ncbi:MAG: serine hydrolase [Terrimicrobiaceae bacterium]|nr:serine hydrolase [Terrimicrobiaceae bacterium]
MDLDAVLADSIVELACPAILCAVNHGGEISTHSAGTIPATAHDRAFYIYSITKTFTATAILLLFEREGLSLDRAFSGFFPETPIPRNVTIRQLLNHTGGLSDYGASDDYQQAVREHPGEPWDYERLMRVGLAGTPLFDPGSGWAYSNPGYALLNELIGHISGVPSFDFLRVFILEPLGLPDIRPFLAPDWNGALLEADEPSIAGDFRRRYAPGWIAPGCLIATAADVARFYNALFGGKMLSDDSLRQMKETVNVPARLPEPFPPAYGLGVMSGGSEPPGEAFGHGGGGPGYTTYARCYPTRFGAPLSLCLVINTSLPATPFRLADEIVKRFAESRGG